MKTKGMLPEIEFNNINILSYLWHYFFIPSAVNPQIGFYLWQGYHKKNAACHKSKDVKVEGE